MTTSTIVTGTITNADIFVTNNNPMTTALPITDPASGRCSVHQKLPNAAVNIKAENRSDVASGPCASMLGLNVKMDSVTSPPATPNSRRAQK